MLLKRHGGGSDKLIKKLIFASMAQLVEQLIRNEQVVGSSPTTSSKGNPRLNVLFEWGLLCCCFYFKKLNIYLKTSINRFCLYLSLNVATCRTHVLRCIINLYIFVAYNKLLVFVLFFIKQCRFCL